jgi:hypothetical protein
LLHQFDVQNKVAVLTILALIVGVGDLSLLERLYKRVLVSFEVCQEIEAGGTSG